jgi:hypothetical protein
MEGYTVVIVIIITIIIIIIIGTATNKEYWSP